MGDRRNMGIDAYCRKWSVIFWNDNDYKDSRNMEGQYAAKNRGEAEERFTEYSNKFDNVQLVETESSSYIIKQHVSHNKEDATFISMLNDARDVLGEVVSDLEMQSTLALNRGEPTLAYHLRDQANKLYALLSEHPIIRGND
jgi:hypothetical protein